MADLSIGSGSGSQTTTQSPQSLVNSGTSTAAGSSVQPGTATNVLTNSNGILLGPTQLSSISFNDNSTTTSSSTAKSTPTTAQPKHHFNATLLGVMIGLFIIAIAIFLGITRSAKNTTNYS